MTKDWSLKDKKYNIRCYANDYGSYYCDEDMADCHTKTNFNRENWIEYYKQKRFGVE
jgi:hypothetical protein